MLAPQEMTALPCGSRTSVLQEAFLVAAEHELLLEWVSELGSGTWEQFRRASDWLLDSGRTGQRSRSGLSAASLSVLGHREVDWAGGRWPAAPPVITVLPSAGAHALLAG